MSDRALPTVMFSSGAPAGASRLLLRHHGRLRPRLLSWRHHVARAALSCCASPSFSRSLFPTHAANGFFGQTLGAFDYALDTFCRPTLVVVRHESPLLARNGSLIDRRPVAGPVMGVLAKGRFCRVLLAGLFPDTRARDSLWCRRRSNPCRHYADVARYGRRVVRKVRRPGVGRWCQLNRRATGRRIHAGDRSRARPRTKAVESRDARPSDRAGWTRLFRG